MDELFRGQFNFNAARGDEKLIRHIIAIIVPIGAVCFFAGPPLIDVFYGHAFAESGVPFLDMAANQGALAQKIADAMKPSFIELGLSLESFVVENISLPDELQKMLDQRISMNMIGDMGKYTQFQVAQSIPIAAANEGGGGIAGIGVGLGAGLTMANSVLNAMKPGEQQAPPAPPPAADTKFCTNCGNKIPRASKFCPECGTAQQ